MAQNSKSKGSGSAPKLTIGDGFFAMHPFENVFFETDRYYDGIVKKIVPLLKPMKANLNCEDAIIKRLALCFAAYLEDQVSGLGLWSAFIHRHRELYGKWLPWYDTAEDYYDDEVNLEDVRFLLWLVNASTEGEYITSPSNTTIESCANAVFNLLQDEFENAPINQGLVDLIYSDKHLEDFYSLKNIFIWMTKTCYLMAVPGWQMDYRTNIYDTAKALTHEMADHRVLSYFQSSYCALRFRVGPLALYPKEWLVLMRQHKGITKGNDDILNIQSTPLYPFMVVSNNADTLTLRSCRGVEYDVTKESFGANLPKNLKPDSIIITSLVNYKGKWGINGLSTIMPKSGNKTDSEELLKEMAQKLYRFEKPVDIFNVEDTSVPYEASEETKKQLDDIVERNNGRRMFYFADADSYMKWFFKETGTERDNYEFDPMNMFKKAPVFAYIGTNHRVLIFKMARAINDPSNPFYKPEDAYMAQWLLYNKGAVTDELAAYLVEHNCLKDMIFEETAKEGDRTELTGDNLKFFATFYRQYPC